MEKITFTPETEEEAIQLFVLEKTRLGGVDYLLVTDREEGDAQALILKDVTADHGDESTYEVVSDDKELDAVAAVFESLLDDIAFVEEEE
ncbi:MAG: DUF1292 domain-containing protein [Lachnospiraceae bacterium]|nr:DUF1292 domain-containing protein [Lachnospiraceae bacterium]